MQIAALQQPTASSRRLVLLLPGCSCCYQAPHRSTLHPLPRSLDESRSGWGSCCWPSPPAARQRMGHARRPCCRRCHRWFCCMRELLGAAEARSCGMRGLRGSAAQAARPRKEAGGGRAAPLPWLQATQAACGAARIAAVCIVAVACRCAEKPEGLEGGQTTRGTAVHSSGRMLVTPARDRQCQLMGRRGWAWLPTEWWAPAPLERSRQPINSHQRQREEPHCPCACA